MIFADKLIQLRKKSGWSQEELAEQMNVTRQSVSKWEGAQSVPDLEKIVRLSNLFKVSIDYLLKDEIEEMEGTELVEEVLKIRQVSMEEASTFLSIKNITAKSIGYATFLCIISPICLLILGAMSQYSYGLSENIAVGIGMIVLLICIAIAVSIFILNSSKTNDFKYLEKEIFETEYGVDEMIERQRRQYKSTYIRNNILGASLCTLSLVPLFCGIIISEENELILTIMLSCFFVLVGIGVIFFIQSGIIWESFEMILQEGSYSKERKEKQPIVGAISTAYWLIVTAIYLACSLTTNEWGYSWIVWVVAGVLYPAIIVICNTFSRNR